MIPERARGHRSQGGASLFSSVATMKSISGNSTFWLTIASIAAQGITQTWAWGSPRDCEFWLFYLLGRKGLLVVHAHDCAFDVERRGGDVGGSFFDFSGTAGSLTVTRVPWPGTL